MLHAERLTCIVDDRPLFAALEVDIKNREQLDQVIAHTLRPVESIHFLPVELNAETLRAAFEKVERFVG